MGKRPFKISRSLTCVLCNGAIPLLLQDHPRTKYCGRFCRDKAQRIKYSDKRRAILATWKARNPKRVKEQRRQSQERCKAAVAIRRARWIEKNPEKMREHRRKWRGANKDKVLANTRLRQLKKCYATPAWLSADQKKQIQSFYRDAMIRSKQTGSPHDVDHIIPINGKDVCGLHVPWNLQVIPRTENIRKSNKIYE